MTKIVCATCFDKEKHVEKPDYAGPGFRQCSKCGKRTYIWKRVIDREETYVRR